MADSLGKKVSGADGAIHSVITPKCALRSDQDTMVADNLLANIKQPRLLRH